MPESVPSDVLRDADLSRCWTNNVPAAMSTINAWNRHAITMCTEVGKYQPKARPVSQTA
ncbi:MAG TPA: hypothetical protein VMU26_10925 [Candidatus Polarisedimenticolia bacterium]|nr:hypothetical protein [Candidatus Polarisedimenticolia bacterium]